MTDLKKILMTEKEAFTCTHMYNKMSIHLNYLQEVDNY